MNISIEWPRGRGQACQSLDDTDESLPDLCDFHLVANGDGQSYPTPYDLAPTRRREWPSIAAGINSCELFNIYLQVRATGLPNMLGPRIPVPSMLNIPAWQAVATGHHDDAYVLDGVRFGFPLHYTGPALARENRDAHSSAQQHWTHVKRYVEVELQNNALLGPFDRPPFVPWTNISPVMTRPKAESTKRRIIVDLSFPQGNNVNAHIHKNIIFGSYHEHRLPTVRDTLQVVEQMEFQVKLATIDVERAYRNIPVCPLDLPLLGIKVGDSFFIDEAMPFGARNSSLDMQLIAQFMVRALRTRGLACQMYLDDMVLQLSPYQDFHARFMEVMALYRALGLPISYAKLQPPADAVTYLGIHIDVPARMMSIPVKKIKELEQLICLVLPQTQVPKKMVQRLIGKINHIARCVEPARLFMAWVLAALRDAYPAERVCVSNFRSDLHWFACFLRKYNGRSIIKPTAPTKVIMADSCLTGGGGTDMNRAYELVYTEAFAAAHHISTLEAINCLVAMRTLLNSSDRHTTVEIQCDSESAITALAHGRTRDPVLLAVCRATWYLSANMGIRLVFTHIPEVNMQIPDALSRAHLGPSHRARADDVIAKNRLSMLQTCY